MEENNYVLVILSIVDTAHESQQLINLNHVVFIEPIVEYTGTIATLYKAPKGAKTLVHLIHGETIYSTESVQEIAKKVPKCAA